MLVIDFNSFIIYIKLFLLFYIIKKTMNSDLKNNFMYYSIIDISYSIIIKLFLYSFNGQYTIFYFVFYNFGVLCLFWQLYNYYSIISIVTNQKKKHYYFILLLPFVFGLIKLIIKIFFFVNAKSNLGLIHFINQSKLLFIFIIICYLLFQFFYIIPVLIQSGIYLSKYKINKSLKKILYYLLFLFLIKIIIENFQIGFLEFFKILIYDNQYFRKLIAKDSDTLIAISSFFSTTIYLCIIFFINIVQKIIFTNYNYSYLKNQKNNLFYLSVTKENMAKIFIENNPLKNLIYLFALENIKYKYNLQNNMFAVIEKNNLKYEIFFNSESFIYQHIDNNKLIYYDLYYDIYHAQLLAENDNLKNELFKNILVTLDDLNIRLIIPIYKMNSLDSYFVVFQNTFNIKNDFNEADFKYFFDCIKYLDDCNNALQLDSFYSKLIFENKIADLNVLANNEIYENNYKKLNEQVEQIKQLFIYENSKNTIKHFVAKSPGIATEYLNFIHKNKKTEDRFSNHLNFIFKKNEQANLAILSTEKIQLNTFVGSLYCIFPFFKKDNDSVQFSLDVEKINSIFPFECHVLDSHRYFFNFFHTDFKIKIIIHNSSNAKSLHKIISYISESQCVYLSLKNIYNIELVKDIFNKLLKPEIKYYVFFTDINYSSLIIQKNILDAYLHYIVNKNYIFIKIFFLVPDIKFLSHIHNAIVIKSKITNLNLISVKNINKELLTIILKNYSYYILKKIYSLSIIEKINKDYYESKLDINFYTFLDFFEKIVEYYALKDIEFDENDIFYINQGAKLEKEALKNIFLMEKLANLYNFNFEKIAKLLNLSKSRISKYYQNISYN